MPAWRSILRDLFVATQSVRACEALPFRRSLASNQVDDQQKSTNDNGTIRKIEGKPMILSEIEIQEVCHTPVANPIQQIAGSAPHDKGQRYADFHRYPPALHRHSHYCCKENQRNRHQQACLPGCGRIRKQAKSRSGIMRVGWIKKMRNNGKGGMERNKLLHHGFRELVSDKDQ